MGKNKGKNMKCYQVATKQENTPAHGGIFYTATKYHIDVGSTDCFILCSEGNGLGDTSVDDVITVTITDQSDSNNSATYTHDYSNGCSGVITPLPPVDLNSVNSAFNNLRGKTVSIAVTFADKCGGVESGTNIYICLNPSD